MMIFLIQMLPLYKLLQKLVPSKISNLFLIFPGFGVLFEETKIVSKLRLVTINYSFCYLNSGFAPRLSFALSQIL